MDFSTKICDWNKAAASNFLVDKSACIILGIFEEQMLSGAALDIDFCINGLISRVIKIGDMDGRSGKTLFLHEASGTEISRVLLVGLGKQSTFSKKSYVEAVRAVWHALLTTKIERAIFTLAQLPILQINSVSSGWRVRTAILALRGEMYRFTQMKSKVEPLLHGLNSVMFTVDHVDEELAETAVKQATAIANGMDLTRDLGNLPGNVCTPTYLANIAKSIAKTWKIKVDILGLKKIQSLNMGSFLSVAHGSVEPPQFIVLHYYGTAIQKQPIVLVGKGITFDSGGISLKPGEGMDEMKYDMCGGGSVLGTIRAIVEMKLKINVIGIVPTCENMPSSNATKPGDIITSMNGLTIEILNTDAEGRLILCDALTYAERFKPAVVIDVATLTGACVIALGHHNSGLFSKDDGLSRELLDAAREADDPAWRLPLDEEYHEQLKSNFADIANIGCRAASSITAACFLSRFTETYPWAHLDIAGTAWKSGTEKGATGRPVPLLTQFLINRADHS
ncbi:MAG: leucyl aminopeptidase [Burkholderia sp.]|nr:leucyl aminopeptidase [Burkholderia sp.]